MTIYENSKVEWLEDVEDAVRVHAPYGAVTAAKVALATNVFPSLVRKARKYVVPVFDYEIVTEPLSDEQLESIGWAGREGVADSGNQFHYYRLTQDRCILWGGYDAIYNFRGKVQRNYEFNADTYATLASHFLNTFPQLAGIKFTHGWGRAIDTCTRFSPFWGTSHEGKVAYVLGFTGLGVASTRFGPPPCWICSTASIPNVRNSRWCERSHSPSLPNPFDGFSSASPNGSSNVRTPTKASATSGFVSSTSLDLASIPKRTDQLRRRTRNVAAVPNRCDPGTAACT